VTLQARENSYLLGFYVIKIHIKAHNNRIRMTCHEEREGLWERRRREIFGIL